MKSREVKTALYKEMASVTKALGNPHRLEILDLLAQGPVSVEYVSEHTNMPIANASQHLQVLRKSNLVTVERRGKYSYYRLSNRHVYDVWQSLRKLGFNQNSEIQTLLNDYRGERKYLHTITADEFLKKMQQDNVILLDVRPDEEYQISHIHGAISAPIQKIKEGIKDIVEGYEIIAYCRGPLCMMADNVVQMLNENGHKAYRLDIGVAECEQYGIQVDRDPQLDAASA